MTKISVKNLPRCSKCNEPFIKAYDDMIEEVSDYLFEPNCSHYPQGVIISVG